MKPRRNCRRWRARAERREEVVHAAAGLRQSSCFLRAEPDRLLSLRGKRRQQQLGSRKSLAAARPHVPCQDGSPQNDQIVTLKKEPRLGARLQASVRLSAAQHPGSAHRHRAERHRHHVECHQQVEGALGEMSSPTRTPRVLAPAPAPTNEVPRCVPSVSDRVRPAVRRVGHVGQLCCARARCASTRRVRRHKGGRARELERCDGGSGHDRHVGPSRSDTPREEEELGMNTGQRWSSPRPSG